MFASIAPFTPIHYEICVHSGVNVDVEGKCRRRRTDGIIKGGHGGCGGRCFKVGTPSDHANAITTPLGLLAFAEQHERLIKMAKFTQVFDVFKTRYSKRMTSSNRVTRINRKLQKITDRVRICPRHPKFAAPRQV